jgi:hypothetical protein
MPSTQETPEVRERRIGFAQAGVGRKHSMPLDLAGMAAKRVGLAGLIFSACYFFLKSYFRPREQRKLTILPFSFW